MALPNGENTEKKPGEETLPVSTPNTPPPNTEGKPPSGGTGDTGTKETPTKVETKENGGSGQKIFAVTDADAEIPPDAELIQLSRAGFKSRLERESKKTLKARFGTDDTDEIAGRLDRLKKLEEQEEERRVAALSENEREKELRLRAEKERDAVLVRHERYVEQQVVAQEDTRVKAVLEKHLNPRFVKRWIPELAEHIASLSDEALADPNAVIEDWCKEQIKENPEIAIGFKPVEDRKVPITNGANSGRPDNATKGDQVATKTAAPGKPNSMNKAELEDYKRQHGIRW